MARILVLDDDAVSGRLLSHMLQKRGHEVFVCARSIDAWRRLDSTPVDLMFVDTELEGEYGWEVVETVRADVIFKSLAIVVCSSNSKRDIIKRYLSLGVLGIVIKPYSAERIFGEVERATRTPWRDKLFETSDSVQARTGLTSGGLARLYRDAAEQIDTALVEMQTLREDPANAQGLARLATLRSCGMNVGFKLLAEIADQARAFAHASDKERLGWILDRLPVAKRLLEMQSGIESVEATETQEAAAADPAQPPAPAAQ